MHKLVCEGTVEERIAQLIDDKQALADVVVGQGEAWLTELSTAQLQDLVRLDAVAALGAGAEAAAGDDAAASERASLRESEPSSIVFGSLVHRRRIGRFAFASGAAVSRPRHAFGAQPGRLPATLLRALCAELSDPARYRRAKDYARDGAVIDLDVRPGAVVGEVLGSRRSPYRVTIVADPVDDAATVTSPVMLIPERTELAVACTCPDADSGAMCKHALALLLVFADEVSIEPELLARWRAPGGSAPTGTVRLRGRAAIAPAHATRPGLGPRRRPLPRAGAGRRAREAARLADADRRLGRWLRWRPRRCSPRRHAPTRCRSCSTTSSPTPSPRSAGRARPTPGDSNRSVEQLRSVRRPPVRAPHSGALQHSDGTTADERRQRAGPIAMATLGAVVLTARRHDRPGRPAPVRRRDWRDALVVIVRGAVDLECPRGGRRRFEAGTMMSLEGLGLVRCSTRARTTW